MVSLQITTTPLRNNLQLSEEEKQRDPSWQGHTLNMLYHNLCQSPQNNLSVALNEFLAVLKNQRTFAQQYAETMLQAGKDVYSAEVKGWGEQLANGLKAFEENLYQVTLEMFTAVLQNSRIEVKWQPIALGWRGATYRLMERYEQALQDFDRAIELDPKSGWAITGRGKIYQSIKCYEQALQDFDRAIELDPKSAWAIASRGQTYRLMKRYEEALQDLNRAIELDPKYDWVIASRGQTYRSMKHYEKALQDFDRAIELNPKLDWAIASRGETYRLMKQYTEALQDFDRAIELDPKNAWPIASRGQTYLMLKLYNEALADFNRAIDLDSDNWYLYNRALTYQALNQSDKARTDLALAIKLAKQHYGKNAKDWRNAFNLALYYLAVQYTQPAEQLYRYVLSQGASLDRIHAAIQNLNDFLTIFPNHLQATSMRQLLQSSLTEIV